MKKYQKYSAAAGILLFVLAALFSVSLLSVALDFGGANGVRRTIFYSLGKMFTGVYGFTAICVPVFLIVAGIQCFSANWRIRNGVLLLGSVIPFFTLDAIEHICRMIIASDSDSVMAVKLGSTLLIGSLVLAAEYLLLSILGDVLENSIADSKEYYSNDIPQITDIENSEEELEQIEEEYQDNTENEESLDSSNVEESTSVKLDPTSEKIFQKQKELLKDLIDDKKEIPSEEATVADNESAANEDETITDDPTIIDFEDEEIDELPETIEEEELIPDEKILEEPSPFEQIFDEPTVSSEEPVISNEENVISNEIEESVQPNEQSLESTSLIENEDDELIAEMNRVYSGNEETVEEPAVPTDESDLADDDISSDESSITDEDSDISSEDDESNLTNEQSFEEPMVEPIVEESLPVDTDDFNEPTFTEDDSEFDEPVISTDEPDLADDDISSDESAIPDEDSDIFSEDDEPNQTNEHSFEETEESEEINSIEENPADFINIEDIAEESSDENESDDETMSVDDIFSEMDADAAENPVFKAQPVPMAHDSLYQESEIQNQINEINDIDFDEDEISAPDVVTDEDIENAENSFASAQDDNEESPKMRRLADYKIPTDLLEKFENNEYWKIDEETRMAGENLKKTLNEFGIEAEVTGIRKGPVVTMFEILPAPGVKLSKIVNLQDNIALSLAAKSVRIVAPIPGRHAVGIEIPNKDRAIVSFREIIEQDLPDFKKMSIPVILGKDISGQSQIIDIAKTPHLLIAGATGAGKSVCVNSIILSILYNRSPNDVKLIMVDPKVVELKLYNDIPHLLTPVVTEPKRALQVLQYCICEMERRYALLDGMGVRDIVSYNNRIRERHIATEKLPYIVVIIDEFADLMATSGKELETNVARLTAMSRAVGIHLVLATQRPSVNVITGLIKANIPSRIAFMVASRTDSNIIIDATGAEKLLGKGDMLYTSAVNPIPTRIQGTLVGDNEVERVVEYVKSFGGPDYIDDEIFVDDDEEEGNSEPGLFSEDEDPLYDQALQIVVQTGKASASYIQRRLKIGYNRAARLVEEMEERGIVGPANGSKPREIIHMP